LIITQPFNFQRQKIERNMMTQGKGSTQFQVSYKIKTLSADQTARLPFYGVK